MTIKKLPSGFWHVRFGPQRFIQWPVGATPCSDDTFGFFTEDKEDAARRAAQAVEETAAQEDMSKHTPGFGPTSTNI